MTPHSTGVVPFLSARCKRPGLNHASNRSPKRCSNPPISRGEMSNTGLLRCTYVPRFHTPSRNPARAKCPRSALPDGLDPRTMHDHHFALSRDVPTIRTTQVNRESSLSRCVTVPEIVLTVRREPPRRTGRRFAGKRQTYPSIKDAKAQLRHPQRGGAGYPSSCNRTSRMPRRNVLYQSHPWERQTGESRLVTQSDCHPLKSVT